MGSGSSGASRGSQACSLATWCVYQSPAGNRISSSSPPYGRAFTERTGYSDEEFASNEFDGGHLIYAADRHYAGDRPAARHHQGHRSKGRSVEQRSHR